MKKILFTIQWYPSVLSANALCDEKIIKQLVKENQYDISCLTYRSNEQSSKSSLDNVKIYRFRRSVWWNLVIKAKQNKGLISNIILRFDKFVLRVKQILTIPIYPIVNIKSCIKFAYNAYCLHKKNKFDIVISEHHGIDSLFAGYVLKRLFPDIKFIAILWDPISAKEAVGYLPSKYSLKKNIYIEKKILQYADYVVGMKSSEKTVKSFNLGFNEKHKFFDIPGIVKQIGSQYKCDKLLDGCINIVYSGILSLPDRNPSFIIDIINSCPFAERINFVFFCTGAGKAVLERKKKSFKGSINICEYIPHSDLISVYQNADILLNFGGVNTNMVPSKIFEYMSFCKPILSTYKIDNDASKTYLDRYPLALCIDERKEVDDNLYLINHFFQHYKEMNITFESVERKFFINTPNIYINLINTMH